MHKWTLPALWLLPLVLLLAKANYAQDGTTLKPEGPMTNARLEQILRTLEPNVQGAGGQWQMVRGGIPVMVLTDESHNRMRVIAPATEVKNVDQQVLTRMMEANFTTALDVRYAIFKGTVWVVFIHPLDSLRERDFISAFHQVVTLVTTTGTTYSSSGLQFGTGLPEE